MGKRRKLVRKILLGRSDANIPFSELLELLRSMGFTHRQKGSHHVLNKPGFPERLTLQAVDGKAKRYQVRQVRKLMNTYNLKDND